MSEERPTEANDQGVTRRELLRKGAVLGGALAWSIPTVQTIRMAPAFAAATSFAISYVAVVAECNGTFHRAKWEVTNGGLSGPESGGSLPCENNSFAEWPGHSYSSDTTIFSAQKIGDNVEISVSGDCKIVWSLNKCAQICIIENSLDTPSVTFKPCPNPNA